MKKLKIGTSVIDITGPLELGILMSSVKEQYCAFDHVRLPLKGRILVLEQQGEKVGIVTLDLLGMSDSAVGGWDNFKMSLSDELSTDKIIVVCTHTHSSHETAGLTDLYKTTLFGEWLNELKIKIKLGIKKAISNLQECEIYIGTSALRGFSLQRRILKNGEVIMSDSIQPIDKKYFDLGPIDHRIRSLKFTSLTGENIATLIHAVCHPVHEMCSDYVSPDFPGEACITFEEKNPNGICVFFNGACGDINPPTVSEGVRATQKHGKAIVKEVEKMKWDEVKSAPMSMQTSALSFRIRENSGINSDADGIYRINTLIIGDIAMVFLSGENFTDTAYAIENGSPFKTTIVIGYAENYVGYIPPRRVFEEGGYEVGPGKWSYLEINAEEIIVKKTVQILHQLKSKAWKL